MWINKSSGTIVVRYYRVLLMVLALDKEGEETYRSTHDRTSTTIRKPTMVNDTLGVRCARELTSLSDYALPEIRNLSVPVVVRTMNSTIHVGMSREAAKYTTKPSYITTRPNNWPLRCWGNRYGPNTRGRYDITISHPISSFAFPLFTQVNL